MRTADEIENQNDVSYQITQPVSVFRTYRISFEQRNSWNFNGTYLGSDGELSFSSEFKNQWNFNAQVAYHSKDIDTKILRGGPDMLMPASSELSAVLKTDASKKLIATLAYQYQKAGNNSASGQVIQPGISLRPFSMLKIGATLTYEKNRDELQYVVTRNLLPGRRYILGTIVQETLGLTFRVDLNISPEFSIQYYGSPFISKGSYSELKRIKDPEAKDYGERFAIYQNPVLNNGTYYLSDNDDIFPAIYTVGNPDFNFHQFRSNLVAKWEYRLGSFIYLVWSSERTGRNDASHATFGDSYAYLGDVFPKNIFLIKLNFWFSL
jgi:hypothetical protein